ncbi:MAG: hypothetical protein KKI02_05085 [Planctomycetes bacterium]|nr:hypothetical protein [Planctomycetota bacterium]
MNRARTPVCLIGSALLVAAALAQDDLPEWPERKIDFELLDDPMELTDFTARPGQIWPRLAVSHAVDSTDQLYDSPLRSVRDKHSLTEKLLNTNAAKGFSERQREFVRSSAWLLLRERPKDKLERFPGDTKQCTLYAVTEQDARLMAEASLEILDARRRANFEEIRARLLKYRARLAEAEEELPEAEQNALEARETYESAQKASPHKNREAAQEDLERLEVSRWSIEVSIAGINAKIAAIRRLKAEKDATRDLESLQMLDRLLMEQDIELAGLLAEKAVIESRLNLAKAYVSAGRKYDGAVERIAKLKDTIKTTRKSLEQSDDIVRNPGLSRRPVRLFGNVVIQPIEYPGE